MLRSHAGRLQSLIIAFDHLVGGAICLGVLSLPGMASIGADYTPVRVTVVALVATFLWPLLFDHFGLYRSQRRTSFGYLLTRLGVAALISVSVVATVAWAVSAPIAPVFPLLCSAAQLAVLGSERIAIFSVLRLARRSGRNFRNLVIVGSGPRARHAKNVIDQNPGWGLRILAFVDDSDVPVDPFLAGERVHKFADLPALFRDQVVDEVVVACPRSMISSLAPVVGTCASVGVPVTIFSDFFGDVFPPPRASQFGGLPALSFTRVHHSQPKLWIKRGIDIGVAGTVLLLAAPILGAAALAIKLTSRGPVLFRQVRCGLYGRPFQILKLRTMLQDAESRQGEFAHLNEASGPVFKIRNDPRVTPVGRLLRRLSIDELPQLWNVLRGDMSLVGPRPPIPSEVVQYEIFERRRLSMRPGITCLWQVMGRSQIGFSEWVRLDLQYIDTWSLMLDLRILAQTLPAVLRGTGAS